jgi:hypothetical protein
VEQVDVLARVFVAFGAFAVYGWSVVVEYTFDEGD